MGARGILVGQVVCCALMAAAILACATGSTASAETKVRPVITIFVKGRPITAVLAPPATEARVLPDWPNALAEEDRIRSAAASEMCAWKRIPGAR